MGYTELIRESGRNPARLEETYQNAVRTQTDSGFADALQAAYTEEPDNLLYAAWHYRLGSLATKAAAEAARHIPWLLAVVLAAANGLLLWLLSDPGRLKIRLESAMEIPYFLLLWAPLAAVFVLAYLARTGVLSWRWWAILAAALALTAGYGLTAYTLVGGAAVQEQYLILVVLQIPVIAWTCVGIGILHGLGDAKSRFAFLLKSLEIFVLGGLFLERARRADDGDHRAVPSAWDQPAGPRAAASHRRRGGHDPGAGGGDPL